jgi:IMP dehydrogenase
MGGLGFLHYNMKMEEQVMQAQRVKQHVPGFVTCPATLAPHSTIADFESMKVRHNPYPKHCQSWQLASPF